MVACSLGSQLSDGHLKWLAWFRWLDGGHHTNISYKNIALRPRKPEGSLGRTAQDGHLDSHTAPELWVVAMAVLTPLNAREDRHVSVFLTIEGTADSLHVHDEENIHLGWSFLRVCVCVCVYVCLFVCLSVCRVDQNKPDVFTHSRVAWHLNRLACDSNFVFSFPQHSNQT